MPGSNQREAAAQAAAAAHKGARDGTVETADLGVISGACRWLHDGRQVALVTVLETWGSSPRPPGALMAMSDHGRIVGSVSGGCVDEELLRRYREHALAETFPALLDFGVESGDAARLGLPCGGRLRLLVEALDAPEPLQALLRRVDTGALVARRVCLETGEVSLHEGAGRPEIQADSAAVTRVFGPAWHLLLVGDGQLARLLATMARLLDYRVTICDPRETFADPSPLTDVRYTQQMPDDVVRALADDPRSAIVTLAHDPRQDDPALIEALTSRAFYIGALGSRRTAAARAERLGQMGLTPGQIARLDAPAGIPIGSKRPGEIALSILAGVTAARNRVRSQVAAAPQS